MAEVDAVGVAFSDCLRNEDRRLVLPDVLPNEPPAPAAAEAEAAAAEGRLGCECVATISN